jgi:hypothetical protein
MKMNIDNSLVRIDESKPKICHFNITSISAKKCMVLAKLMAGVDIIAIQETHTSSSEELKKRGTIPGFTLIDAIHSTALLMESQRMPRMRWHHSAV